MSTGSALEDILLYDAANSPCGRRVRMMLLEKRLAFQIHWLNLGLMDQKQAWYLKLNPSGVVPTLVHGGKVIFDSGVINDYLEAVFPQPSLLPEKALARIEVRQWQAFEAELAKPFRDAIYQTWGRERLRASGITADKLREEIGRRTDNPAYASLALNLLQSPGDPALLADRRAILMERLAWMESQLADGRHWLTGDEFTLADITVAPRIAVFPLIGMDDLVVRYPAIGAWMTRIAARPGWEASNLLPAAGTTTTRVTLPG